jgi:hypothetical protein
MDLRCSVDYPNSCHDCPNTMSMKLGFVAGQKGMLVTEFFVGGLLLQAGLKRCLSDNKAHSHGLLWVFVRIEIGSDNL